MRSVYRSRAITSGLLEVEAEIELQCLQQAVHIIMKRGILTRTKDILLKYLCCDRDWSIRFRADPLSTFPRM